MASQQLLIVLSVAALLLMGGAATSVTPSRDGDTDGVAHQSDASALVVQPVATETQDLGGDGGAPAPGPPIPLVSPTPPYEAAQLETAQPTETVVPLAPATPNVAPTPFSETGRARWARFAPSVLLIPRIGVDAAVVPVGVTPTGQLEAPAEYSTVGWYLYGPAPGEPGRAVIDGHLDSRNGPAVFYRIGELASGDEIVIRSGGPSGELTFVVRESSRYWTDQAPLDLVYGTSDRPELVLITCAGPFDRGGGGYQQRRIVFAELRGGAEK